MEGKVKTDADKDPRSKAKYNLISRLLFCWLGGLLRHGFLHDLKQSDLFVNPSEADSEMLHGKFTRYWGQEMSKKMAGGTPRLWLVIFKSFWKRFAIQALVTFVENVVNIGQALLLGQVVRYFSLPCEQRDDSETIKVYLCGAGVVILGFMISFLHAHGFLIGQVIGMLTRIMMTSAIYNKILNLSQVTLGKISIGHVINLASNDVQRYDLAFLFVQFLWISPLQLCVGIYLIYQQIEWAVLVLAVLLFTVIPLQILSAKLFANMRFKSAKVTDHRVRIMNEVITGIRVIKMYAWEYAFKRVVQQLRKHEIQLITIGGIIRIFSESFNFDGGIVLLFGTTFLVYIGSGQDVSAQQVFTTLALISVIRRNGINFLTRCFFQIYEASVATSRIQKFLLLEDRIPSVHQKNSFDGTSSRVHLNERVGQDGYFRPKSPYLSSTRLIVGNETSQVELKSIGVLQSSRTECKLPSLEVIDLLASWTGDERSAVIKGIGFKLDHTSPLLSIIGHVGSGKSTLLQCLIGELRVLHGNISTKGKISYASQHPWVFSGTVRENITFGLPYHHARYQRVIDACALNQDINSFFNGDLTIVGERGVTLSGGQKARVNLARAVYRDADIYLLDDPLSAVDATVGKHLFEECLCGILKDKLIILVTHQVHFALQTDQLLVLKEGNVQMYGTNAELAAQNIDTKVLLGLIKEDEEDDVEDEFTYEEEESDSLAPDEEKDQLSSAESVLSIRSEIGAICENLPAEDNAHGSISWRTYWNYFKAGGNYLVLFAIFVVFVIAEVGSVLSDWWLSDWTQCFQADFNANGSHNTSSSNNFCQTEDIAVDVSGGCSLPRESRLAVYSTLVLSTVLLHFLRGLVFYLICINSSRVLHNRMFSNILRVPLLFFDTNPSGRILNRFSKDVGYVDDLLPFTSFVFLSLFFHFIAILVVASIANPYLLTVLPIVCVLFLVLRWYYLKSARDIKRLEAVARSPVYSHFSLTLQGLPTIRTFGQQEVALQHLHNFNNEHNKGWYMYLITTRWLGIRLDLLTNLLLLAVVAFSIPLVAHTNIEFDPSLLGLGLTYTVALAGIFQFCVRQSAELENQMVSTERIMAYSHMETEASLETLIPHNKPHDSWPSEGQISLENIVFRYSPTLPIVLKGVTFSVRPSEKVGIVGRTGAGKSSLLSVLFRLAELTGSITIDGVDTKSIGLHDLRKKMSIIPQDPVLFSGSVRYNLDPFEKYSDAEIWEVLEQVQLKNVVRQMEEQLSGKVSEAGGNFSVGQRQLVCLARALLRKNKILILDEATANVDPKTDGIIQQAIREKFRNCTVITIAHRLNTIMDSDRIMVMSNGRVKEFASPYRLLQNPDSQLFKMVEKTGPEAAEKLHDMAIEARKTGIRKTSIF